MSGVHKKQYGFTLIEVIITIVFAALAGTVIFVYMGNVLTRSHEPITHARSLAEVVGVMEQIVAKYSDFIHDPSAAPGGMNCTWLMDGLSEPENVACVEVFGDMGNGFKSYLVTVTTPQNNQRVSAVFTE